MDSLKLTELLTQEPHKELIVFQLKAIGSLDTQNSCHNKSKIFSPLLNYVEPEWRFCVSKLENNNVQNRDALVKLSIFILFNQLETKSNTQNNVIINPHGNGNTKGYIYTNQNIAQFCKEENMYVVNAR